MSTSSDIMETPRILKSPILVDDKDVSKLVTKKMISVKLFCHVLFAMLRSSSGKQPSNLLNITERVGKRISALLLFADRGLW